MTDVVERARAILADREAEEARDPGLRSPMTEVIRELLDRVAPPPIGRLVLPYPISANDFWRTAVHKKKMIPLVYTTKEADAWKEEVAFKAKLAGFREPTAKPVALRLIHHHKALVMRDVRSGAGKERRLIRNGNVFDLDNVLKVSIDGLKKTVFHDDKQVKFLVAEYGPETEKGGLTVEIAEFVPPQAELFRIAPPEPGDGRKDGLPF